MYSSIQKGSHLGFSTFSTLAFRAWGSAPLLIVHHFFNIKINKPSIIKILKQ